MSINDAETAKRMRLMGGPPRRPSAELLALRLNGEPEATPAGGRCATCRHWNPETWEGSTGECRALPPRQMAGDRLARFPRTRGESWCSWWSGLEELRPKK